ncbi:hypothetical protein [Chitinophaga barathri]|uniref:Uncharacterized protein n=1 Tax=Chitinophaga barathri TaxID=1647451 RepID=A0A3N4M8Y5_9BACT|nr:hypothetical protein [Chitinophaga barathri]RPD39868.1 hypothetical protein EG028_17220 [Chitinophaga barathri]
MKHSSFLTYTLLVLLAVSACRKVDDDLKAQYAQPSISTTGITLPDGTNIPYPKDVKPGDTVTISGRLNLSKGGVIRLGKEDAVTVYRDSMPYTYFATGDQYTLEIAKFVVTPGMGAGPQPLVVTCGPYRHQGPDVNIVVPGAGGSQPDTTLIVTEIFNGTTDMPNFLQRYRTYTKSGFYFKTALHVTPDGTVYLCSAWDVYRLVNGRMELLLQKEDGIIINGEAVTIKEISGAAPSPDNTLLYLSFSSTVTAPDNYNRVNYLVKKDLASGAVTLLNKTESEMDIEWDYPTGNIRPVLQSYGGPVAQVPVFADYLKVDAKGRLLFHNFISYAYDKDYFCRLGDQGKITPLFEQKESQVNLFKTEYMFGFTEDGSAAFVAHEHNNVWPRSTGITVLDLESLEPTDYVDANVNFTFASFDTLKERRMEKESGLFTSFSVVEPGDYLPISRKEMLFINSYSIASINPELAYLYAYAGIERGCYSSGTSDGALLPVQNQLTGPAKYVNYGFIQGGGNVRFLGKDASGKIYLMRGGERQLFPRAYIPPRIFTLSKP